MAGQLTGKGKFGRGISRVIQSGYIDIVCISPTEDHWHGKIDDDQFYEKGINIFKGMQSSAPEGVHVEYMTGFDINGVDENMDQVIKAAKDFDAVVVCVGEHVYSECRYCM